MRGFSRIASYAGFAVFGALVVTLVVQLQRLAEPEAQRATAAHTLTAVEVSAPTSPLAGFSYVFVGKGRAADGTAVVMLAHDSQLLTLAVGGVIDEAWRLTAIGEDAIDIRSLKDDSFHHLTFASLSPHGQVAIAQSGGAALREIVVDAGDTNRLRELAANPPAAALIRIQGADQAVRPTRQGARASARNLALHAQGPSTTQSP